MVLDLIDSHAHLNDPKYDADRDACVARARENGVRQIVNIGSGYGFESNAQSLALAHRYPGVYSTVGLHPHESDQWTADIEDRLEAMAADPKIVAVGEIGLDFYYKNSAPEAQETVFRRMIRLALRLKKPIVIHNRDAHADTERILRDEGPVAGVIHSFTGLPADAERFLALGMHVSIPGIVTFKNAANVQASAKLIPADKLLVETDSPYLTPVPFRGKRNEPAYVRHVLEYLAGHRDVDAAALAAQTSATLEGCSGFSPNRKSNPRRVAILNWCFTPSQSRVFVKGFARQKSISLINYLADSKTFLSDSCLIGYGTQDHIDRPVSTEPADAALRTTMSQSLGGAPRSPGRKEEGGRRVFGHPQRLRFCALRWRSKQWPQRNRQNRLRREP